MADFHVSLVLDSFEAKGLHQRTEAALTALALHVGLLYSLSETATQDLVTDALRLARTRRLLHD